MITVPRELLERVLNTLDNEGHGGGYAESDCDACQLYLEINKLLEEDNSGNKEQPRKI